MAGSAAAGEEAHPHPAAKRLAAEFERRHISLERQSHIRAEALSLALQWNLVSQISSPYDLADRIALYMLTGEH